MKIEDLISNEITMSASTIHLNETENEKEVNITINNLESKIPEKNIKNNEREIVQKIKIEENNNKYLSKEEKIENELAMIHKQNLKKYLMANNQFQSSTNNSEEQKNQTKNSIKPKKYKLYKYVGKTLFLFLDKYENPLLIIGPHWLMYICFCGIISILMLGVYLTLWKQIGAVMRILGIICFWTYFISYTHCSLYNPGYPKNDEGRNFGIPRNEYYLCVLCNFYVKKSKLAHHCFDCDICIENHDHHCPWTGHCIGKNNYFSFFIFVCSSFCIILYIAVAFCIGTSSVN